MTAEPPAPAVDPAARAALAAVAQPFAAPAGATLFRPGDRCPGFVLLDAGVIRVRLIAASGRSATLYRVRPGEMCLQTFQRLVDGGRYGAEGLVETDAAGLLAPPTAFERLMADSAPFRALVLGQVAARFDRVLRSFEDNAFRPLDARLAGALSRLATPGPPRRVAATHAEIAAEIGSAREVVTRQLQRWAAEGLVSLERGRVDLEDPDALAAIADRDA